MLFNSLEFALYFPVVTALFFAWPHRWRWLLLLLASYGFYMAWEPAYGLLLLFSTTVDYVAGLRIAEATTPRARRAWLGLSLALNLGMLFSFKYYNLINSTFQAAAAWLGFHWPLPESSLLLPVGISFYTFQTMSYGIDVYRGTQAPERHFGYFALYVSYFPQLVAGPVERAANLLPQLRRRVVFDADRVASGLRLMAWGMFKKVVVADRLEEVVAIVYADPSGFSGVACLIATFFYGYQVYLDFSGYSDIAVGAARVLGVDLMLNFRQPYLARSFAELWGRWHISMTTWFRDYVYVPLGGNRVPRWRWALNVYLVFLLSGLWHGAAWSYAAWGSLCGIILILEKVTADDRERLARAIGITGWPRLRALQQWAVTFALWQVTLVAFRAQTITDALHVYGKLHTGWGVLFNAPAAAMLLSRLHLDGFLFLYCLLLIPFTEAIDWLILNRKVDFLGWNVAVRWTLLWALVFATLALGRFEEVAFVYFQF